MADTFWDNQAKKESFYHFMLLYLRKSDISENGDKKLRQLLLQQGSFETIFKGMYSQDTLDSLLQFNAQVKKVCKTLSDPHLDFNVLTVNSADFPEGLKLGYASPAIYARGDLGLLKQKTIAVVGTRELTDEIDTVEGKKVSWEEYRIPEDITKKKVEEK